MATERENLGSVCGSIFLEMLQNAIGKYVGFVENIKLFLVAAAGLQRVHAHICLGIIIPSEVREEKH